MVLSWPLIAYVVLGVAAAGILGVQGVRAMGGRGSEVRPVATVVALACALGAAVASALRLGRIDRVFNVFAHLSSGISQGYVAILVLVAVCVLLLVMIRRGAGGEGVPRWCAAIAVVAALLGVYGIAANLTATGLNVGKTLLTTAYLLVGSLAAGMFVDLGVTALNGPSATKAYGFAAAAASGLTGVLAVVFHFVAPALGNRSTAIVRSDYGMVGVHPTQGLSAEAAVSNDVVFWIVSVVLGAAVPVVVALVARKLKSAPLALAALAAAVCVLAGIGVAVSMTLFGGQAVQLVGR